MAGVAALAAGPVRAQHAEGAPGTAALREEARGCGLCHAAHLAAAGAYSLRSESGSGSAPQQAIGISRLGPSSQSCLRCHSTAAVRLRQAEFAPAASAVLEPGTYLQLDLTDDHPVGLVEPSVALRRMTLLRTGGRVGPTGLQRGGADPTIECTTCHDPHRRTGPVSAAEERVLCAGCHEPTRYGLRTHAGLACTDCHALHGGSQVGLLRTHGADVLCRTCHEPGSPARAGDSGTVAVPRTPAGHPTGAGAAAAGCLSCHRAHP